VAIAGALAQRPTVLLLDELTTFLDGEDQGTVLAAVRALTRPGAGVTALWVRWVMPKRFFTEDFLGGVVARY